VESPSLVPTSLSRSDGGHLIIKWSDGRSQQFQPESLLDHCPCATCRDKHGKSSQPASPLNILPTSEAEPISIVAMSPIGNYAYSIAFSRGCNKGIYTFEYLRGLNDLGANEEIEPD
jgi:DUF971 family protein